MRVVNLFYAFAIRNPPTPVTGRRPWHVLSNGRRGDVTNHSAGYFCSRARKFAERSDWLMSRAGVPSGRSWLVSCSPALTVASTPLAVLMHAASVEARLETEHGLAVLTYDTLNTQAIISSVGDDSAGAIAVFIGTTRNSFKGACTVRLDRAHVTS
jgi:hypothetical protein